jgi:hypothetical protein
VINVRVPGRIFEAIDELTKKLGATKTDVIAALLNEGLAVAGRKRGERHQKSGDDTDYARPRATRR